MTAHVPTGPLMAAASQVSHMAHQVDDQLFKKAMLVTSVALVGVMLIKEARDLFRDRDPRGHFREPQWREREHERRAERGHGRER